MFRYISYTEKWLNLSDHGYELINFVFEIDWHIVAWQDLEKWLPLNKVVRNEKNV